MSILENLSDIAHEIRSGAGTVLRTIGSRLEAGERARVDASAVCAGCGHARADHWRDGGCGHRSGVERVPCLCRRFLESVGEQWLTEFEEQRDSLEPQSPKWLRDAIAAQEQYAAECAAVAGLPVKDYLAFHDSADAAADPSPARPSPSPASAGDEGSGGDSDILPSPPPERPQCGAQYWCRDLYTCIRPRGHDGDHGYAGSWANSSPAPPVVAGESPRGVSTDQPSLGEPVTHEDLAAHLTGAAIRANTGHPDVLIDAFASSLLADFNITTK